MTLKQFVQRRSLLSLCSVQLVFATIMLKLWSYFWAKYLSKQGRRNRQMELSSSNEPIELNRAFWRRFFPLLRICIPSVFSREFFGVFMLTSLFLVRTKLTILMARTLGRNSKYLVQGDMKSFFAGIGDVALLSIPGAVSKVGAQYAKIMVQQLFRENLQRQLQEEYLRGNNIYAIATMNALDNPDHRITQTTRDFCNGLTDLLRSVLKPMADAITLTFALAHTGGFAPPAVVLSYYGFVATMMSTLLPNFAHLVAVSQEREGNYRTSHHQMIVHAEEVAFYGGEDVEREHADGLLRSITKHESFMKKVKVWSGIMDSLLIQYGATCIGYVVCGAVTLDQKANLSTPDLTELYVRSTHLYIPLSLAVGKLLLLHKKVAALCSSTHRVGEFRELLLNLSESGVESMENYKITDSNEIKFCNADIAIPSGRYVLKNFNLTITPGKHILVMGSNGSGKSALIRALTRLWPLRTGELYLPADEGSILVLPQRVFLTVGTLRSQMLYPLTEAEAAAKGICDDDLRDYANSLGLAQVLERAGGLSAVNNWHEVLSGGERQRVALVRVLVQQPVFAFLDECTSAVSQADEPMLYARLQKAGVTLISISHREALKALHTELLELDGQGGYRVTSLLKDLPRTTSMSPSMNNAMDGEKV